MNETSQANLQSGLLTVEEASYNASREGAAPSRPREDLPTGELGQSGGTGRPAPEEPVAGGLSAQRFNAGKPELSYVPAEQMRASARALMYGARKYERDNYRQGFPQASIADSLLRHLMAYLAGETHDPESGLHHVDHINANAAFLAVGVEADWPMYEESNDE